mgnify:CR=1 FL=1
MPKLCECSTWARAYGQQFMALHHRNCKHYNPEADAATLITALVEGMDAWGADEDGIHPEAWDAYQRARSATGRPVTTSSSKEPK